MMNSYLILMTKVFIDIYFWGKLVTHTKLRLIKKLHYHLKNLYLKVNVILHQLKTNKTYFNNCIFLNKANFQDSTLKSNENKMSSFRDIKFS